MEDDWRQDSARRAKAALVNTTVPNAARVGDYMVGGRDNFEADRKAVRALIAAAPVAATIAPAASAFHQRAVRYLAAEAGIRQFLDIGTGSAAGCRTHEVAQSADPCCRVVYVDTDPMVLTHARALMRSAPGGVTAYLDADARDPAAIVAGARETLDFGQPVAVLLLATLAFIPDIAAAAAVLSTLLAGVLSGSYVVLYNQASDLHPAIVAAARRWNQLSSKRVTLRSRDEVASLIAGLELVPPGIVPICEWRPAPRDPRFEDVVPVHGLVARKP